MNHRRILILTPFLVLTGLLLLFPAGRWAREHVNYQTGVSDHPLLCTSCHLYITRSGFLHKIVNADYVSPFNPVSGKDGMIYVTAQDRDELLVIDTRAGSVIKRIPTGDHPHSVILDREGRYAYVTNQWSDNISVVDLKKLKVVDTIATAGGPAGLSLSRDGNTLYAVNSYTSDISVISLANGAEIKRLTAGNNPTGAELSPSGELWITSRRAQISRYGDTLKCEITVIDDRTQRILKRIDIESAYMMENVTFTPEGDLAFVTLIRPKNLVPSIQVEQGFMMSHGFAVIEQAGENRVFQLLIDEPNAFYPDPFDVVLTHDGKKAFISSSGIDCVSVISVDSIRKMIHSMKAGTLHDISDNLGASSRYVTGRMKTGPNPKGMTLSTDGNLLYVAEQLNDRISVFGTATLEMEDVIDLEGPKGITVARHGRRLMSNAGHTFQNQYSCYTCHPDGHEDGLVYNMASKDMGRNVTNTQSLRDIAETAPYKWNGKNQSVFRQDGIRFSTVLTRTEPFSFRELDAISAYILTGIPYPPNLQYNPHGILNDAQRRGKDFFERSADKSGKPIPENNRCITCHTPPYYTNRKPADVNTLAATDDTMLFDTPHLNNIFASPPYLHDGRAATLEEIWTKYGTDDRHGRINDLTKMELNDLIEYLKSLSSPEYESRNKVTNIQRASYLPNKKVRP